MNLLEYQGKSLLAAQGLRVPRGKLAVTAEEAATVAAELACPVMVKAQVTAGKRGKAGAVVTAHSPDEARAAAARVLSMQVQGERVGSVLVEEKLDIGRELYAGVTLDTGERCALLVVSARGGVDIEEIAAQDPASIVKARLDALRPVWRHECLGALVRAGLHGQPLARAAEAVHRMVRAFFALEAITLEVNPLVITRASEVVAADAKLVLDDAAQYRHGEWPPPASSPAPGSREARAEQARLVYVEILGGEVGIIAGGAGLAMATMDTVNAAGRTPANFLDVGGGVSEEQMAAALRIVKDTPGVRGIVINVFGGINNCEVMARGIADVLEMDEPAVPLIVKMRGHSQDEGWAILARYNVEVVKQGTTGEAVARLLTLMGRAGGGGSIGHPC